MPYKPFFSALCSAVTGPKAVPSGRPVFTGAPCAMWFSGGRSRNPAFSNAPQVSYQVALDKSLLFDPPGWISSGTTWNPDYAHHLTITLATLQVVTCLPVYGGIMWDGTPESHARFDCCPLPGNITRGSTLSQFPPQGLGGLPLVGGNAATFDIYRPFGAAVPTLVAAPGILYPDPYGGRGSYSGGNYIIWDSVLDCDDTVDIRDGVSRASGLDTLSYSDGDEVRFPTGIAVTRYVVVRVTRPADPLGNPRKRTYLLRDQAHWPGP